MKNNAKSTVEIEKLVHLLGFLRLVAVLLCRVDGEAEVAPDVGVDAALNVLLAGCGVGVGVSRSGGSRSGSSGFAVLVVGGDQGCMDAWSGVRASVCYGCSEIGVVGGEIWVWDCEGIGEGGVCRGGGGAEEVGSKGENEREKVHRLGFLSSWPS